MKTIFGLLLIAGYACAQPPAKSIRRDSVPNVFPPDLMPNARSDNSFYRYKSDPANVMRATLDNMPIKMADSSTQYTILQSSRTHLKPAEPPMRFLKPVPPVLPKNWKKE